MSGTGDTAASLVLGVKTEQAAQQLRTLSAELSKFKSELAQFNGTKMNPVAGMGDSASREMSQMRQEMRTELASMQSDLESSLKKREEAERMSYQRMVQLRSAEMTGKYQLARAEQAQMQEVFIYRQKGAEDYKRTLIQQNRDYQEYLSKQKQLAETEQQRNRSASNVDARTLLGLPSREQMRGVGQEIAAQMREGVKTESQRAASASAIDPRTILGLPSRDEMKSVGAQIAAQMKDAVKTEGMRAASATKVDPRTLLGLPSREEMKSVGAQIAAQMREGVNTDNMRAASAGKIDPRTLLGLPSDMTMKSAKASAEVFKEVWAQEAAAQKEAAKQTNKHGLELDVLGQKLHLTGTAAREVTVMIHESLSGYTNRIPGSMITFLNYIGLAGPQVLKLIAWVGGATAALTLFYEMMSQGKEEADSMNRAIAATGNFANMTRGQMRGLADEVGRFSEVTMGEGKQIVTQLVASGQLGENTIALVAKSVAEYAHVMGKDIGAATGDLIKLMSDPSKGARELDQSMHLLNSTELMHIRNLQEQGKLMEAQELLAGKLAERMKKTHQDLGYLQTLWQGVRDMASNAWDAMLGAGRPDTDEDKINNLLWKKNRAGNIFQKGGLSPEEQAQLDGLLKKQDDAKKEGIRTQEQTIQNQALETANARSYVDQLTRQNNELIKLTDARKKLSEQMKTDSNPALRQQAKVFDSAIGDLRAEMAGTSGGTAGIEARMRLRQAELDTQQKMVELRHKLGQMSELDYQWSVSTYRIRKMQYELDAEQEKAARPGAESVAKAGRIALLKEQMKAAEQEYQNEIAIYRDNEYMKSLSVQGEQLEKQGKAVEAYWYKWYAEKLPRLRELAAAARSGDPNAEESRRQLIEQGEVGARDKMLRAGRDNIQTLLNKAQGELAEARLKSERGTGPLLTPELEIQIKKKFLDQMDEEIAKLGDTSTASAEVQKQLEAVKKARNELAASMKTEDWTDGLRAGMYEYMKSVGTAADLAKRAFSRSMQSMEDTLVNFMKTGKLQWRDFANVVIDELIRIQVKKAMVEAGSNFFGGTGIFGALGSLFGNPGTAMQYGTNIGSQQTAMLAAQDAAFLNAKGNAFGFDGVHAFAKGGAFTNAIVSSPTLFKFAQGGAFGGLGVMGEAGDEAVMPLTRDGQGNLGVRAVGGGGGAGAVFNIQIITNTQTGATSTKGDTGNAGGDLGKALVPAVKQIIVGEMRPGGILEKVGK